MPRLLSDEDLDGPIVDALRQTPLEVTRVQDVGLRSAPDTVILAWAAERGFVVISHDRQTMIGYAYDRVRAGQPMPGLIVVRRHTPIATVLEHVQMIIMTAPADALNDRVFYVPLA